MSVVRSITVKEAIDDIKEQNYILPSIQREFVWKPEQITTLFDSLMRGYPIGIFLLWKIKKENLSKFKFYQFLDRYHEKFSRHNVKAKLTDNRDRYALLDGQQRLSSLYLGLCGSYAEKMKYFQRNNPKAYPEKFLHLNLLGKPLSADEKAEDDKEEMEYDFKFLTKDEAKVKSKDYSEFWFSCSEILKIDDSRKIHDYLEDKGLSDSNKHGKEKIILALDTLSKFSLAIHKEEAINYYLEKSEQLDKVLQIFIRVNSKGTQLSYSDLLLSMSIAQWNDENARETIHNFVDQINEIGSGFEFDKDIVLKTCLVLCDLPVKFKIDNFTKENILKIESSWEKITDALRAAVTLVANYGYNEKSLVAKNALIPIAYFICHNNYENSILSHPNREDDRQSIKEWLARVFIKGTFGGRPDSLYPTMRNIIKQHLTIFPLQEIIKHYAGSAKTIEFYDADIDPILKYQYGGKSTYCVLSLLYPHLNQNIDFAQDHIHAYSLFKKNKLEKAGIAKEHIDNYISKVNLLPNLQLLEGKENNVKKNMLFGEWVNKKYGGDKERAYNFLMQNHISPDEDLGLLSFLTFFENREKKLKKKLKEILGVK